jgi:hypothetical protein
LIEWKAVPRHFTLKTNQLGQCPRRAAQRRFSALRYSHQVAALLERYGDEELVERPMVQFA